jgi:biotin carboxylase
MTSYPHAVPGLVGMTRPRLVVLGAGDNQLPLIRRAIELGCVVITVDNIPGNVGHRLAHRSLNVSTADVEGVIGMLREVRPDGVTTFASDVATVAVAEVCRELGLPGPPPEVARCLTNKATFRTFQHERLAGPPVLVWRLGDERPRLDARMTPPLVVKPADSSGSRGVQRVNDAAPEVLDDAIREAVSYSRSHTVCIAPFWEGVHASGDAWLHDGRLAACVLTEKHLSGLVPTGHVVPTSLSAQEQQAVRAEVSRTCAALGYCDGPLDFDVVLPRVEGAPNVVLLEMSPRLGGNGIPQLIARATGWDPIEVNIRYALGQPFELPGDVRVHRTCGSLVVSSPCRGRLLAFRAAGDVEHDVPEVFYYDSWVRMGDMVSAFSHGGCSLGCALFDIPQGRTYEQTVARIEAAIGLQVECEPQRVHA